MIIDCFALLGRARFRKPARLQGKRKARRLSTRVCGLIDRRPGRARRRPSFRKPFCTTQTSFCLPNIYVLEKISFRPPPPIGSRWRIRYGKSL